MIDEKSLEAIVTHVAPSVLDDWEPELARWKATRLKPRHEPAGSADLAAAGGSGPELLQQIAEIAAQAWEYAHTWIAANQAPITDSVIGAAIYSAISSFVRGDKHIRAVLDLTESTGIPKSGLF